MRVSIQIVVLLIAFGLAGIARADSKGARDLARGRYLVQIGGCNDCHTPGYGMQNGKVDETEWLVGVPLGWQGPWGTTYATNLRLYVQQLSEQQWLERTKKGEARPPMPWFNLHAMSEADLRAIYRYVKSLGPAGQAMPVYLPPGQEPTTPYRAMEPRMPGIAASPASR